MDNSLPLKLSWKPRFLLIGLSLLISISIAFFQDSPGYMDADYYFAGGMQLVEGNGFSEPYIWNFLDNSTDLPHPSHSYWMPFASIIAAFGMAITGLHTWLAGRIGFILVSIFIPYVTAELAFSFSKRTDLSLASGVLAIFSGYYLVFLNISDTFGIYILLGGLYFLIAHRDNKLSYFLLGLISGFFHFTRADGIIWLFISYLILYLNSTKKNLKWFQWIKPLSFIFCGYIIVMGPWFIRNNLIFGSILGPGSIKMLWMTHYNQIFSFPPEITIDKWLDQGFMNILSVRLTSFITNLQSVLAVQGSIFLFPLILVGWWKLKLDLRIKILTVGIVGYLIIMSVIFPFAGMRGGFFHAGASLQSVLWVLAPIGLEELVERVGKKKAWDIKKSVQVFLISTISFAIIFSGYLTVNKLFDLDTGKKIWSIEAEQYRSIKKLINTDIDGGKTVIVRNPPGFYLATGNMAVAIPDGGNSNLLLVAERFKADYLILEPGGFPQGLMDLYMGDGNNLHFTLIREVDDSRIYEIDYGQ